MNPTSAVLFEPDLLFSSKIEIAARRLGIPLTLVTTLAELLHELDQATGKFFIVNLDLLEGQLPLLRTNVNGLSKAAGYCSHVNSRLVEEAKRLGFSAVLSRRAFAASIDDILSRFSTL